MVFPELRERVEALIRLGSWSNASPEPDYAFLVNEGLRIMSRQTCHNVEAFSITTAADTTEYLLDTAGTPAWIAINDDVLLSDSIYIPQTTRDQLRVRDRLWRMTPSGDIQAWYWTRPGTKIGFYPTPSAIKTLTGEGPRHEPELDSDDDEPLLNLDFHEGIALYAAWHWGKLHARGEERAIAEGYRAEADDYALRCRQSMDSQEVHCFVRRVARPTQEYLSVGAKQTPAFFPS